MIEQVCAILHYQREILDQGSRRLFGQEADAEGIAKFPTRFPP